MNKIKNIVVSIAIPEVVGFVSSLLTAGTMGIYQTLNKPAFSPPGWIFGPVWALLFALMGYASYRVWVKRDTNPQVKKALTYYGIQLILNFFWSLIFFAWQLRGLALIEIVVLLVAILLTTVKFYKVDRLAGQLLLPYIAWVTFATVLNYSLWVLNN